MPENWAWCRLGEISSKITDGSHNPPPNRYSGIPMLSATNIFDDKINYDTSSRWVLEEEWEFENKRTEIEIDDVLLTIVGTIGRTAVVKSDKKFALQRSVAVIKPVMVNSEYIHYMLQTDFLYNTMINNSKGTAQKGIYLASLKGLFFPLPPLAEQKRIVAKVEELLVLVEELETNKTDLRSTIQKAKAKVLDMAIRGQLVPQNPDDEPASVLLERVKNEQQSAKSKKRNTAHNTHYEEEAPFEIPENWVWCRLGEIGEVISGGTPQTSNENYWNGDVSWITPADLSNYKEKYISRGKRNISMEGLENSSAKIIRRGSVLFSSRAPIGYVAISEKEVSTNQGFKSISPYIENSEHYIYYFLLAEKENISLKASGTTFKELSGTEFGKILFPLPPLAEQRRIVEKIEHIFSVLDELEEILS
ncbi:restriction endonuclease subunit S [Capnocytophaga canis]|uniref:restriction endonuclease subunit S n=1 Tax=Capnocytophaga canis TaxID=1848903 RepID=UPI00370D3E58